VKLLPINARAKEAYVYYRDGLSAQNDGDYAEALENYEESLKLEENAIDRGETLKNIAIIYMSNGEEERALETYQKALDENPKQPSCLKNMGLIYEKRGRTAEEEGRRDDADGWFDLAADVWTQAVRLNPGGYLDIENWLKSTGRSNVDVYF
jgi:tetratricopeptide (TPR) repeat protein